MLAASCYIEVFYGKAEVKAFLLLPMENVYLTRGCIMLIRVFASSPKISDVLHFTDNIQSSLIMFIILMESVYLTEVFYFSYTKSFCRNYSWNYVTQKILVNVVLENCYTKLIWNSIFQVINGL